LALGAFGFLNSGSVMLGPGIGIVTTNDTAIGFAGLVALSSSPGLSGIQPQLNAEGLADWARRLVDPAAEAAAAGLG
jgi:hypothetical protein